MHRQTTDDIGYARYSVGFTICVTIDVYQHDVSISDHPPVSQIYNDLSVSLSALGINATAEQVKVKLKNLKRLYQERRRKMACSGAAAAPPLQHQELLDELLAGRPSTAAASGEMGLDFTFAESGK